MRLLKSVASFFLLVLLFSGCANIASLKDPEVSLVAINPLPAQGMSARFNLKLHVVNPNNVDLTIDGVYFRLEVAGSKLFSGVANDIAELKAYGETTVDVNASMSLFGFAQLLLSFGDYQGGEVPYKLSTTIDPAGWLKFDVEQEGVLSPELLSGLKGANIR